MDIMEIAKTELSRMIETAGENGITEGEVVLFVKLPTSDFSFFKQIKRRYRIN